MGEAALKIKQESFDLQLSDCVRDLELLTDDLRETERYGTIEQSIRADKFIRSIGFGLRVLRKETDSEGDVNVIKRFEQFVESLEWQDQHKLEQHIAGCVDVDHVRVNL